MAISLVVHGGAGGSRPEVTEQQRAGLKRALDRGWEILSNGGSAVECCEQAIIELEDEPVFDAGLGSYLNKEGRVELDAILMDGKTLGAGAVAAVEHLRNPIRLARLILERSEHIFLVGNGAEKFAVQHGLNLCDVRELITPAELERWKAREGALSTFGTVGAVARDSSGNVAGGTSTGGTFFKYPGRVGDSPLIGCGCYADNLSGAVSCTGHGESIMKIVMAKTAADFLGAGQSPQTAADKAIEILGNRTTGKGGLIVLNPHGGFGVAYSTAHMSWAVRSSDGTQRVEA